MSGPVIKYFPSETNQEAFKLMPEGTIASDLDMRRDNLKHKNFPGIHMPCNKNQYVFVFLKIKGRRWTHVSISIGVTILCRIPSLKAVGCESKDIFLLFLESHSST